MLKSKIIYHIPRIIVGVFFTICLILGILIIYKIIASIVGSSVSMNFFKLINDKFLLYTLSNTAILYCWSIMLQIAITIIVTINYQYIRNWIKLFLILPFALGVVAPGFAVNVLFSTSIGPFQFDLLGKPRFILVLIDTWQWLGVILVACYLKLEQIPKSYFEQSRLEGISRFRRWWFIARPELSGIFILYALLRLIDWVRKVDIIKALCGDGGPGNVAETIGVYIVKLYYQPGNSGFASLLSLFQLIVLGILFSLIISQIFKYINEE